MTKRKRRMVTETRAERIKRLRLALPADDAGQPVTQAVLAARLGVSVATIARWENERAPRFPRRSEDRRQLAHALGVSLTELLTGQAPPPGSHELPAGAERRRPTLRPLREAVSRVQAMGEDVLVGFVSDVVALSVRLSKTR